MINLIDIGLVILVIIAFILLSLIIFNIPAKSSETFSETPQHYIDMITTNIDPIVTNNTMHTSNEGKFLSIPDGLKINMEDIIKMSPNKKNKYLEDSLFANVITYNNDDLDNEHITFNNLGIGKCLKNQNCESCVEYGMTGTAMCFPKK
jgi:hypothetical protein